MNDENAPRPSTDSESGIVHHWFVRYNPLYFFSALCVLGGVFLVSHGLGPRAREGRLALAATVQVYELLLLAGAALLYRGARQTRPAVILAMLEVFFLFDWSFQTEFLAAAGGPAAGGFWLALAGVKIAALAWIFRLRVPLPALAVAGLGLTGLVFSPQLIRVSGDHAAGAHLAATWFAAALLGLGLSLPLHVTARDRLGSWAQTVLSRSVRVFWVAGAGFYLVHLAAWSVQFSVPLTAAHAVPFLLIVPLLFDQEAVAWISVGAALLVALLHPPTFAAAPTGAAVVMGICAWGLARRRLWAGVVLAAELALWTLSWSGGALPGPVPWVHLASALVLLVLALCWSSPFFGAATAVSLLPLGREYAPGNVLEWGVTLLAVGFLALVAGVAFNWNRRGERPGDHPPVEGQPRAQ
ncbi:MAG: hypothetical protein ACYTGB_09135 [Planctomycetota bacterium]|jgi:hypothetical protein